MASVYEKIDHAEVDELHLDDIEDDIVDVFSESFGVLDSIPGAPQSQNFTLHILGGFLTGYWKIIPITMKGLVSEQRLWKIKTSNKQW